MGDDMFGPVFREMVLKTVTRRLDRLSTEELLNTLGFLIQRERRKSAEEEPVGLYPIL